MKNTVSQKKDCKKSGIWSSIAHRQTNYEGSRTRKVHKK